MGCHLSHTVPQGQYHHQSHGRRITQPCVTYPAQWAPRPSGASGTPPASALRTLPVGPVFLPFLFGTPVVRRSPPRYSVKPSLRAGLHCPLRRPPVCASLSLHTALVKSLGPVYSTSTPCGGPRTCTSSCVFQLNTLFTRHTVVPWFVCFLNEFSHHKELLCPEPSQRGVPALLGATITPHC